MFRSSLSRLRSRLTPFLSTRDLPTQTFSPPSTNLMFHYSAQSAYTDSGATTLCSVDGVDTCYVLKDLSPNGYDLVQTNAPTRPLWIANGANGHPALRWPSSTGGCDMRTSGFSRGDTETIYVVTKPISETNGSNLYDSNTNNHRGARVRNSSSNNQYELYSGGSVINSADTVVPFGTYVVHMVLWNTLGNATIQINQQTALVGNPGTQSAAGFTIGAITGDNASFEVTEVYGYTGNHSPTIIGEMQTYLATLYAITL